MIDVQLERPHAVILQRLTGVPPQKFTDIVDSLRAQGIEPRFLSDPRVVQAALDDLVREELVGVLPSPVGPSLAKYIRLNDPTAGR